MTDELSSTEPSVRDLLAMDRTELALERTLLAYLRFAFAWLITAATVAHLFHTTAMTIVACVLAVGGVFVGLWGARRMRKIHRHIHSR